jgi:hypothetical protein
LFILAPAFATFGAAAESENAATATAANAALGEWPGHEQHIAAFNNKIDALERELSDLLEQKKAAGGSVAKKELLDQLVIKHKQLEDVARDRETELAHMRFQHPEKGDMSKREYLRYEVQSLEEMESAQGLQGRLDRIKKMIEAKYQVSPSKGPEREKRGAPRGPAADSEPGIVLRK